ncbi:hypothetical protein C8Q80DRAFT_526963 [Daedaleopsis nitida]|nr:hypothetical protein C8Q80DRAFT_526963 [Daedaleopsis nitida]
MAPRSRRNMGWRKPVPRLSPESSAPSSRPARGLRRPSLLNVNKDMPPLPTDWRETMEHAIKKERRLAVYVPTPPAPPPKDNGDATGFDDRASEAGSSCSRPESAITLVDEEEEPTAPLPPPHPASELSEDVECTQMEMGMEPAIARRASQKSLPKIYRPPTPPLPAQHSRLRSVGHGHSRASSESQSQTTSLYPGQTCAEHLDGATPCPSSSVLTGWASRLAPDVSATLHSPEARSHVLTLCGNDPPKAKGRASGSVSPRARRGSATPSTTMSMSVSTGNRSSSSRRSPLESRSRFACHMCDGVWYALKTLGLHLRAKMAHGAVKY